MASAHAIPARLNGAIAAALLACNAAALTAVPAFLLPRHGAWGVVLAIAAGTSNALWSLVHEAIHDVLLRTPRASRALGRVLAVAFGGSLDVFRIVHRMHHKHNRTALERVEALPAHGRAKAQFVYFANLFGGTYVSQLVGLILLLCLPTTLVRAVVRKTDPASYSGKALRAMTEPKTLRAIRQDTVAVLVAHVGAFALYGRAWPLLAAALAARAFLVSIVNYVYHYDTPLDDVLYARNLRLPGVCSKLLLHFNFHGVHHRHPSLPWTALPAAFSREASGRFDGDFARATLAQLGGLIDVETLPRRR